MFDSDPVRVAVLGGDPNYAIVRGCAFRKPPAYWDQYFTAAGVSSSPVGSQRAILFLHECRSPDGSRFLVEVERTAAAIYVLRQPADVLLSNFHYARRSGANGAETREEFDRYVDRFLENRGDPRWRQFGMGSWDEHVHSWIGIRQPFPVVSIRYEDLTADAPRTCRRLADFLKLVRSDEEIAQAVRNSSFERMRDLEATDIRERRRGIFYKPYLEAALGSGLRFMRSGAVGEGARRLTPEQRARLAGIFEPLSAQLGYQV